MFTNKLVLLLFSLLLLPTISSCRYNPLLNRPIGDAAKKVFTGAKKVVPGATGVLVGAGATVGAEEGLKHIIGDECPDHVICDDGVPKPVPGYQWVDNSDPENNEVRWTPGLTHSLDHKEYSYIIASDKKGFWIPADGYRWSESKNKELRRDDGRLNVIWYPGSSHDNYPNIVATEEKNTWSKLPGYTWVSEDEKDLKVKWTPGILYRRYSNVVAAETEGYWLPERGYKWVSGERRDERRKSFLSADSFEVEEDSDGWIIDALRGTDRERW